MQQNSGRLTVYFENPFWVGIFERCGEGALEACKIVFGAEPKDYEVYDYLLAHWHELKFSPPVNAGGPEAAKPNPKRMQREIKKQLAAAGAGTKAQLAIKLQQEAGKTARKQKSKLEKDMEKDRQYALRQAKKKQKHKGH